MVRRWGFEPVRFLTWNKKTVNGKPAVHWLSTNLPGYNSEMVLHARRGSPPQFVETAEAGFVTCFDGVRHAKSHSRKPDEFYEIIRKATPGMSRVDIFARGPHEGFEQCGDEVDKFPALPEVPTGGRGIVTLEDLGL
jgi:N6-adenosine-specific RNA methylase IME4